MKITEGAYNWNGRLSKRAKTEYIILHHRAGDGDAKSIHQSHLALGWTGIGYHFYVRKDGSILRGRPEDMTGAHCAGASINLNPVSVGVCFEGNFEYDKMPEPQLKAGCELVSYLKDKYKGAKTVAHKEVFATACPGKNFPLDELKSGKIKEVKKLESPNDIVWELDHSYFKISDKERFVSELGCAKDKGSSLYWGYYKLVNKEDRR